MGIIKIRKKKLSFFKSSEMLAKRRIKIIICLNSKKKKIIFKNCEKCHLKRLQKTDRWSPNLSSLAWSSAENWKVS